MKMAGNHTAMGKNVEKNKVVRQECVQFILGLRTFKFQGLPRHLDGIDSPQSKERRKGNPKHEVNFAEIGCPGEQKLQ